MTLTGRLSFPDTEEVTGFNTGSGHRCEASPRISASLRSEIGQPGAVEVCKILATPTGPPRASKREALVSTLPSPIGFGLAQGLERHALTAQAGRAKQGYAPVPGAVSADLAGAWSGLAIRFTP
jgi:hypothetical protein